MGEKGKEAVELFEKEERGVDFECVGVYLCQC